MNPDLNRDAPASAPPDLPRSTPTSKKGSIMRKNRFLAGSLMAASLLGLAATAPAQLILSEINDGPLGGVVDKWIEVTNVGTTTIADTSIYDVAIQSNANTGPFGSRVQLPAASLAPGDSLVISNDASGFQGTYGFAPDIVSSVGGGFNGNDRIAIVETGTDTVVDIYGVLDVDGASTSWENTDTRVYRRAGVGSPNATFTESEWIINNPNDTDGETAAAMARIANPGVHNQHLIVTADEFTTGTIDAPTVPLQRAISNSDLINGIAPVVDGIGIHSAASPGSDVNTTDGAGNGADNLSGLLEDSNGNAETTGLAYSFAAGSEIEQINIFTQNAGADARIFVNTRISLDLTDDSTDNPTFFAEAVAGGPGAAANGNTVGALYIDLPPGIGTVYGVKFDFFSVTDAGVNYRPEGTGAGGSIVKEIDVLAPTFFDTVFVRPGSGDGQEVFDTVNEALDSFEQGGSNEFASSNGVPNTIILDVASSYVFDEIFVPGIFGSPSGVLAGTYVGTDPVIVRGSDPNNRALLLIGASATSLGDGLFVSGGVNLTFQDVIIATSETTARVGDEVFNVRDNGTVFTMINAVLTALPPAASVPYSSYVDEATLETVAGVTGILDGTAPYDETGLVQSGDNGFFIGGFNGTDSPTVNLIDTIITQQGTDQLVVYGNSTVNLSGASAVTAGRALGFQLGNTVTLNVNGSPGNLIRINDNTGIGIRVFNAGAINLNYAEISGNPVGIFDFPSANAPVVQITNSVFRNNAGFAVQNFADIARLTTIDNCLFIENGTPGDTDSGHIELLAGSSSFEAPALTISNSTFVNSLSDIGIALGRSTAVNDGGDDPYGGDVTFNNVILAGTPGEVLLSVENYTTTGTLTLTDVALVEDGEFGVGAGNGIFGAPDTSIIKLDPVFVDPANNDVDVQADSYGGIATGGTDLTGYGAYIGGVANAAVDLAGTPTSIDFGSVDVNTTALDSSISFTNTGGASALIEVVLSGADADQFEVAPVVVPGGGSATLDVTFAPTNIPTFTANAQVDVDGASAVTTSNGPVAVTLTGQGTEATSANEWMLLNEE